MLQSRLEADVAVRWHLVAGRPVRSLVLGDPRPGVPAMVVVPGLGALGYLLPLARACAPWTQVHVLDLPGYGHRTTARLPSGLHAVATTLAAWLTAWLAERETPVLLLGHSTGAQSALQAARAVPESVQHLVLAGTTFRPETRRPWPLVRAVLRTLPYEQLGQVPAVLPYYARGRHGLPALVRTALADAPERAVAGLARPLLVLRGQDDRLCGQAWATQLAELGRGRAQSLPGAHNSPWTFPELNARVLRDLVQPPF